MIIFLGNDHSTKLYKDIIDESKKDSPDIVVSCQYRYKIPKSLIDNYTCVNIHYGKLPEYRGCNPIYWQIKRDTTAGVTIHYVHNDFDNGDIIASFITPIACCTADQLYGHLAYNGKKLFQKMYQSILNGTAPRRQQNETDAVYYRANMVDFEKDKFLKTPDERSIRALHFEGKQYPVIEIGGVYYELHKYNG